MELRASCASPALQAPELGGNDPEPIWADAIGNAYWARTSRDSYPSAQTLQPTLGQPYAARR